MIGTCAQFDKAEAQESVKGQVGQGGNLGGRVAGGGETGRIRHSEGAVGPGSYGGIARFPKRCWGLPWRSRSPRGRATLAAEAWLGPIRRSMEWGVLYFLIVDLSHIPMIPQAPESSHPFFFIFHFLNLHMRVHDTPPILYRWLWQSRGFCQHSVPERQLSWWVAPPLCSSLKCRVRP